jgi:hypothetical protein
MSKAMVDLVEPTWVRLSNAAIFLLSLLAIVPVGLLAWVMVGFLTEPSHSRPSISNIWVLIWAVAASIIGLMHIVLSAVGLARPKRAGTLRMLALSAILLLTCPPFWSVIFGQL